MTKGNKRENQRKMSREILNELKTPYAFSERDFGAYLTDGIREGRIALAELEHKKLHKICEILDHPEFDQLVNEGKITLGIIKPLANDSKGLSSDDQEAANKLLDEIDEIGQKNIVFSFSTKLNGSEVDEFYQDVKKRFTEEYYDNPPEGQRIWESIYKYSQSGPLTFVLFYHEEGDAIAWWREKMGNTHPNEADPESIRGKYAKEENLPNNLVHGSDSIESVKKEISVMTKLIRGLVQKSIEIKNGMLLFSEERVKSVVAVRKEQQVLAFQRGHKKLRELGEIEVNSVEAISYSPRDSDRQLLSMDQGEPLSA